MPWLWLIPLIIGIYLVVKLVQGIRDFVSWWSEGRVLAQLQQKSKEHSHHGHPTTKPPTLKEKPSSPMRPPKRGA